MRCKNCGWENPDSAQTCAKCHSTLGVSNDYGQFKAPSSSSSPYQQNNLRSTVREAGQIFDNNQNQSSPNNKQTVRTCPKCSYPIGDGMTTCPMCGFVVGPANTEQEPKPHHDVPSPNMCPECGKSIPVGVKFCPNCGSSIVKKNSPYSGTVNPWSSPAMSAFCTLKAISWDGESVCYDPITYSGDTIVLNRANTDPNNNSITSKEQAVLIRENGKWYIENRSAQKTTMLCVNRRIELQDGDIVFLGNRSFEFKG